MDPQIDAAATQAVKVAHDPAGAVNNHDDAGGGEAPEAPKPLARRPAVAFVQRATVAAVSQGDRSQTRPGAAVAALLIMPSVGFLGASVLQPSLGPSAITLAVCVGSSFAALFIAYNTSNLNGAHSRIKSSIIFVLTIVSLATFVIGALELTVEYKACSVDNPGFRLLPSDKKPV